MEDIETDVLPLDGYGENIFQRKVRWDVCCELSDLFPDSPVNISEVYIYSKSIDFLMLLIHEMANDPLKNTEEFRTDYGISRAEIAVVCREISLEIVRIIRYYDCVSRFCGHALELHPDTDFTTEHAPQLREDFKRNVRSVAHVSANTFIFDNLMFRPESDILIVRDWLSAVGTQDQYATFERIVIKPLIKFRNDMENIRNTGASAEIKEAMGVFRMDYDFNALLDAPRFLMILASSIETNGKPEGNVTAIDFILYNPAKIRPRRAGSKIKDPDVKEYLLRHTEPIYTDALQEGIKPTLETWATALIRIFEGRYPNGDSGACKVPRTIGNILSGNFIIHDLKRHADGRWSARWLPKEKVRS